ncbi:tetratricopeptide repeat protein [Streptomyces sp. NPDC007346]|uniref:tetratricopeptide repeat protein n=1 Tax=Streptomyces sp. NPDC007346 TaxID=3154682 RepID=UPI0034548B73
MGSVAQYIENGVVLPPQAYGPVSEVDAPARLHNAPGTRLFVGRKAALDRLDAEFATPGDVVVQAVHGLGGVGKSALAAHWAIHHYGGNPRWWIAADSPSSIATGLAQLARALQPAAAGLPEEILTEWAVQWLSSHDDWLIVLDNADHVDHVRPLLDRVGTGRFLITTRRATGWHSTAVALRLDVLEEGEAIDLFARILGHACPGENDGIARLCSELGHLPLAVEQAASYCAETGTSPRTYLRMLAESPAEMYADTAEGGDAARTIARVWRITLDRLADTPLTGRILRVLAWYGPDGIPRDLLTGLAPAPALTKAIGRLIAYSMITNTGDGTFAVHRLVQALARTPDPEDPHRQEEDIAQARAVATAQLDAAFPETPASPRTWPLCRALVPHVEALTEYAPAESDSRTTARLLNMTGVFLMNQGLAGHATTVLHRAHRGRLALLGEGHPDTLASSNNLASAYLSAGNPKRAIPLYESVLADCTRLLGGDHSLTLTSRNSLASAYLSAGDLHRAIPLHESALEGCARVLGKNHPDTLTSRNNLAYALQSAGELERAIPLYESALDDCVRVLGEDHPDTLSSRDNLAYALQSAGELERAIPLHRSALDDYVRVLGEDHPHTLTSRNNLATAYQSAGDLERAISLHERVLDDCVRMLGEDHPDTLSTRNNLAAAYQSAGELERAISLHERVLDDCVRMLGEDHPHTLTSRNNLAAAYQSAGRLSRAISLYESVLESRLRVLGRGHPDTRSVRSSLDRARAV